MHTQRPRKQSTRARYRRRRLTACVCVLLVGTICGRAVGYLTTTGFTNASASVGALATPTITGATAGAGTVALSWSSVAAPAGAAVSYYVTRAGGTVGGNCPGSPGAATTSTSCTDSGLSRGSYTYTVTAIWQSWTTTSASSPVSLSSGALAHFALTAPSTATAGGSFSVTVTAQDASNNTVVSYTGSQTLTFSGPGNAPNGHAPLYPASVSFTSGAGTTSVTLYDAESTTLTATQAGVSGTTGSITVGAGANAQVGASATSPQTAGTAFSVTLTAQDSWGNPTGNLTGTKSVSFSGPSSSPNSTAPTYPATVSFSGGSATASVTLKDAQTTPITVTDTTDALAAGATGSVVVDPAAANTFTVPTPATQTAGTAFNETLTALDTYGNTATGYTGAKTITFTGPASSPSGTAPSYPAPVTFTSGAGTASITLYDVQSTTLTATQGSVNGASGSFAVVAGADHQIVASATSPKTAGTAFNVSLTAQDSWGNPTGSLSGTRSVSFSGPSSSPNSTAPTYPATVSFSGGTATASVTLTDVQTTTITVSDATDGLSGVASASVVVGPGSASSFSVPTPATQTAGTAFNETLTALDAYGNTATGYTGTKTIMFSGPSASPGGTAPSYPASVTFTSGAGTGSVKLYDAQSTTLHAAQGTLSGTSGSFTVQGASAGQLLFTTEPGNVTHNVAFGTQPVITAKDAYGNVATGYAKTIRLSIVSGPSGGTLSGCSSSGPSAGVTTFSGCKVSTRSSGTNYTLKASDGTLSVNSTSFSAA